jgi:hypothetical protein
VGRKPKDTHRYPFHLSSGKVFAGVGIEDAEQVAVAKAGKDNPWLDQA